MDTRVWLHACSKKESATLRVLHQRLSRAGIQVGTLDPHAPGPVGVAVADPGNDSVSTSLDAWSREGLTRILVVLTSQSASGREAGWRLLAAGASDVIAFDDHPQTVDAIIARLQRWQEIERLVQSRVVSERVVGGDRAWLATLRQAVEIAHFSEDSVLLLGETGTGKEQIARLIHDLDPRESKGELVILDCSTIVPDLAGSAGRMEARLSRALFLGRTTFIWNGSSRRPRTSSARS